MMRASAIIAGLSGVDARCAVRAARTTVNPGSGRSMDVQRVVFVTSTVTR